MLFSSVKVSPDSGIVLYRIVILITRQQIYIFIKVRLADHKKYLLLAKQVPFVPEILF